MDDLVFTVAEAIGAALDHLDAAGLLIPAGGVLAAMFVIGLLLALFRRRRKVAWVVVDGSNVLHWDREEAALGTVAAVLRDLEARGLVPVVWFDANVGYKVADRYLGPVRLARALGLSERQVFVAPSGTPADPLLLDGAAALGARIVSNDRFRDWTAAHPIAAAPGALVRGRVRNGEVRLEFPEEVAAG